MFHHYTFLPITALLPRPVGCSHSTPQMIGDEAVRRNSQMAICCTRQLHNQIQVEGFSDLAQLEQANTINKAFLEPLEDYRLPSPLPRLPLEESPDIPQQTESRVAKVLAKPSPSKASGPDQIPNWLLKKYSDFVAFPVMEILNASF